MIEYDPDDLHRALFHPDPYQRAKPIRVKQMDINPFSPLDSIQSKLLRAQDYEEKAKALRLEARTESTCQCVAKLTYTLEKALEHAQHTSGPFDEEFVVLANELINVSRALISE